VTDDSTGSVRKPALDEESDGLDCFATESLNVIETADDSSAAVVEPHVAAVGAGASDVRRQWLRDIASVVAIIVLAATVLTFQRVTSPAEPVNEDIAAPVELPRSSASSPSASAAAQPIARPATEPVPETGSRVAAPNVARVAPSEMPSRRPTATREASAPAPDPDAGVRPVLPMSAANESPIVAAPVDVRSEPAPETPRALAAPAVIVPPPSERSLIERVLEAYRDAYDRLDAPSAAVIWPRVDTRALNRAFSTLAEQDLLFDSCDLDIAGARANARCVGEIRYVRRVGDQAPRVRKMSWSFALERVSDRWQIAQVTAD
jgi:hypothetical protein